jgi:hypothetical protein
MTTTLSNHKPWDEPQYEVKHHIVVVYDNKMASPGLAFKSGGTIGGTPYTMLIVNSPEAASSLGSTISNQCIKKSFP